MTDNQLNVFDVLDDVKKNGLVPGKPEIESIEEPDIVWKHPVLDIRIERRGWQTHRVYVGDVHAATCWNRALADEFVRGVVWVAEDVASRART